MWQRNVRELQNIIERALILNPSGPLTFEYVNFGQPQKDVTKSDGDTDNLDNMIARHIHRVLDKAQGKVNGSDGAAALLGMNPSTLRNRMRRMGIEYGRKFRS